MEISVESCVYTQCYCEENVWKLCEKVSKEYPEALGRCYVMFISNKDRCVPIWKQRVAKGVNEPVHWDYHVILAYQPPGQAANVFDFDTVLPFPCSLQQYIVDALRPSYRDKMNNHVNIPTFLRIIDAATYLEVFASDRSHMWNSDTKMYSSSPPTYPCITSRESTNNIQQFISMDEGSRYGAVMSLSSFVIITRDGASVNEITRFCNLQAKCPCSATA